MEHSHVTETRVLLTLILACIILVPLGLAVYSYRNNLLGLVLPSNLNQLVNTSNSAALSNTFSSENMSLSYDNASRTFSVGFNFTSPFAFNFTLDSLSADLVDHDDGFPLGHVSINGPVCIVCSQSNLISVNATLTPNAAEHIASAQTLDIDLSNFTIAVQGIVFQSNRIMTFEDVPFVSNEAVAASSEGVRSTGDG
jgi:hypothetical protein